MLRVPIKRSRHGPRPLAPELTFPVSAAVHPSGRFVFVAGLQDVWSFARYLYVMAFGVGAQANQFAIEDDGTLTPLTPFQIPMWTDSVAASATWR